MMKLLGRLPQKTRRAIQAVKLKGKSVAEAAERYGMSQSDVKIGIHRGLKALASSGRIGTTSQERPRWPRVRRAFTLA
jgi:DNA-directed RNA polymerase specialized sigma24 family protein